MFLNMVPIRESKRMIHSSTLHKPSVRSWWPISRLHPGNAATAAATGQIFGMVTT